MGLATSDNPPKEAIGPLLWCRQAKERGILEGDLCQAQCIALEICKIRESKERRDRDSKMLEIAEMYFNMWLRFEHPSTWKEIEENKSAMEEMSEEPEMKASTMEEMIEILRQADELSNKGEA